MKPAFDNTFCQGKGGSDDIDIILGGGLLNDDTSLEKGGWGLKSGEKWFRNM